MEDDNPHGMDPMDSGVERPMPKNFAVVNGDRFEFDGYAGQEFKLSDDRAYATVAIKFRVDDPHKALEIAQELQKITQAEWGRDRPREIADPGFSRKPDSGA